MARKKRHRNRHEASPQNEFTETEVTMEVDNFMWPEKIRVDHVPLSFSCPWRNSDVALRTKDNSLFFIHANKMTMASFSPFFHSLFFSDFAEKKKIILDLDIVSSTSHTLFPPDNLRELYEGADMYDIPLIRKLVNQQLTVSNASDAFKVAFDVDLEHVRIESVKRMTSEDVKSFLNDSDENRLLSIRDMKAMMEKFSISGISPSSQIVANSTLDQTYVKIPENFGKPWGTSNAILRVNDVEDAVFHVNKSVLATFSPFFYAVFFGECPNELQDVVDLDVEYDILLEILRILHHVKRNFTLTNHKTFDAEKLSNMYRTADKLDIEVIKELCRQQLVEASPPEALQVAIELKLTEQRAEIVEKMTIQHIDIFLSKNEHLDQQVFSPKEMARIVKKTRESFSGIVRCYESCYDGTLFMEANKWKCSDCNRIYDKIPQ